jgi:Ni,Fe-hydrogenase maturation factor
MLVVGCEPSSVEADGTGNFELSPPVQAALNEAVETIKRLIERARSRKVAA